MEEGLTIFIAPINNRASSKQAIVSVVPFDSCFQSQEKFGFNVESAELDECLIKSKRYLYGTVNRSLLGGNEKPNPYVIKNYPQLNKNFETIFKLLDTEPSLKLVMREFLTKYKAFYKDEGLLLDTIGFDNVLFYKTDKGWQFMAGSVIKHDTGALTKKMLEAITKNPAMATTSEYFTSVYYMPACIRALNACAEKVGMDKVIDDIVIDEATIEALANIPQQLSVNARALNLAKHGRFSTALELYLQSQPDENTSSLNDTAVRDKMGTLYWDFLKTGGKATSGDEIEKYLAILCDERNKFPDFRQKPIEEAIEGLGKKLLETTQELKTRYKTIIEEKDQESAPGPSSAAPKFP